jgi:prevent-host-death family protein
MRKKKPSQTALSRDAVGGSSGRELRETPPAEPPVQSVNVRAAKDRLSSLLDVAAAGAEIVITSDGQPKARLAPVRARRRSFRMDWEWLRAQPVSRGAPAEDIIRADRDGRG